MRIGAASAPLLYASPTQINAQVPFESQPGTQTVTVTTGGVVSTTEPVTVGTVSPAIFVVVKNSDFSLVTESNPVRVGDVLVIYATGLGSVAPPLASGQLAPVDPLSSTLAPAVVTIGGVAAEVFSPTPLLAPGFVGLYQVNVQVTAGTPSGPQLLVLMVDGQASTAVFVAVE